MLEKNLPSTQALHHQVSRILHSCGPHPRIVSRVKCFKKVSRGILSMVTNSLDCPTVFVSSSSPSSTSSPRSFVQCFIDHEGSIRSRDLPASFWSLLLLYFAVVESLSFSLSFRFSRHWARNFFNNTTMDSGALPTQASMILWFFRGRQRPALRENKQTTKVVEKNSSLRHILVPVWTEVFPRRFLFPFGRSRCHPVWFFGFFFQKYGTMDSNN